MSAHPVVLFDGVCNLCNATVQWLIERDTTNRLRFASLQSNAAQAILADAGVDDPRTLPDSIVLVDTDGVHVRSDAALRIAGYLPFPYPAAKALLFVPGLLRDAVYRTVARNRYRWFGRRDTCMRPTPDLRDRFLDAEEPAPPAPAGNHPRDRADATGGAGAGVKRWAIRFVLLYLVLYMLPFPLSLLGYIARLPVLESIPGLATGIGWVVGAYAAALNPVVAWVGAGVFGVDATPSVTGSGDMTYNYVLWFVTAALALVGSVVWTGVARGVDTGSRIFDAVHVAARWYLGTVLLTYGWIKVFPLQFSVPGPDRLIQSFGDASPMGLTWTFLGASTAYQVFAGIAELVGGYLVLWRRTALLGALFSAAVMLNVMAINFFFDVPVKIFSMHLVLFALFIMAPDLPRLAGLFGFNLPVAPRRNMPFWYRPGRKRWPVVSLHLVTIGVITAFHITDNLAGARSYGFLREESPLTGVYQVTDFVRGGVVGKDNEDADRWVRVGINPPFAATVQYASGRAVRMRLQVNETDSTLSLYDRGATPPSTPMFVFTLDGDSLLGLDGTFEGQPLAATMQKTAVPALLTGRGFRWINEFPFNR